MTAFLAASVACSAQDAAQKTEQATVPAHTQPAETLHAGTQLVIVDVGVQDRSGHAIHGLKHEDFVVTEQKKPQTVRYFDEHSATADQKPGPAMPPMPPGTFTDYTPVAPDSTLNVLLIDALNTPMKDQMFVRQQLLEFVKHEKPGVRTAIFGLTNRLVMLQGFTADPAVLQAAVQHRLMARASVLMDDPVSGGETEKLSDTMQDLGMGSALMQTVATVQQFEAEQASMQTQMRVQYTMDAFNALGHYLSNFPGRKNLLWFSGSFPIQIEPDPTIQDPFAVMADNNEEFRQTTNLLTNARTAVYPIDGRGLMTPPMFDAANSGARSGPAFAAQGEKFSRTQAAEHMTMEQMASDTGGQAFYNTNGLWQAAEKAIDAGSNYYTLAYTPNDRNRNGAYRSIHVELSGSLAAQGYRLSYRHGYYADDPQKPAKAPKPGELPTKAAPVAPSAAALADRAAEAYTRAAIARGAPAPSDILFKVRVLPLTGKDDDSLAADNKPDPNGKMKPPYRTFAIDYVAMPDSFSMTPQSDGRHAGAIEFTTFVYDADGYVLNILDKTVELDLLPDTYKEFMSRPVRFQLLVSAPVKQQSFLRVIVHDVPANRYGAVEIPTAEVGRLPAVEAQNTPAEPVRPSTGGPSQPTKKQ